MDDDSRLLVMWSLSSTLAVATILVVAFVVPALVNLHNDGTLLMAIFIMIMMPVLTFISARRLCRAYKLMGDNNK